MLDLDLGRMKFKSEETEVMYEEFKKQNLKTVKSDFKKFANFFKENQYIKKVEFIMLWLRESCVDGGRWDEFVAAINSLPNLKNFWVISSFKSPKEVTGTKTNCRVDGVFYKKYSYKRIEWQFEKPKQTFVMRIKVG